MTGYQITFYTLQNKLHKGKPLGEWLVQLALEMGLRGATLLTGNESFGHGRRIHSARFFELADQPVEVIIATTAEEADQLFERLKTENIHLFYMKIPIEFGILGKPDQ